MREDIASIRKEYTQAELDESTVLKNPFQQFEKWFQDALDSKINEPTAMVLSTVNTEGQPFQRTVLLKTFNEDGFVFYTNYESRKAGHLNDNPRVSLLFPWYSLERQVAITGQVEKVSTKESLKYFLSRPEGSQLGAWVSNQSEVITSRNILETKLAQMKQKFKDGKIPLPDHWGGYRIIPDSIEFWQGRKSRLHDRIFFQKETGSWQISRLAP
ncbi:pyridoxamine 5'-phosphate oxidase [Ekhidna sp. To15]|uniref:pyridoxamine 5'-phosphate oxidase n=1 Tax=Ekhidna sp. To15 TaxID=3395267 RepID=UPI003F51FF9F